MGWLQERSLPPWLPSGAALHVDFARSRFFWGGQRRALSDLTAIGDGSYTLPFSAVGGTWTGGYTVMHEAVYDLAAGLPSGVSFGWRNSSTQECRIQPTASNGSGVNRAWTSIVTNPNAVASLTTQAYGLDAQSSGVATYAGINRSIFSVPSNDYPKAIWSGTYLVTGTGLSGSIAVPSGSLHFGRHPFDGVLPTNTTLRAVTFWQRALSEAEMRAAQQAGAPARRIHMLGDSFLTHGRVMMAIKALAEADGTVVGWSQDGVGGSTLADQATRFEGRPYAWNAALIIEDGSLELDGDAAIAALQRIISKLTHTRYAYRQSNPINPLGDSRRTNWIAYDDAIRAFLGEDHYIPTLDIYLAAGNGSTEDNARIAAGQYPRSLSEDLTHVDDPNFEAAILYNWLRESRWVP